MARWQGTTKQRGLGYDHVKDKERLLAIHREGTPCWRCGKPMYKAQGLDRDHVIDRAHGGASAPAVLAHASCNRSKGARAGNQAQPRLVLAAGRDVICTTCGKPYHYAARSCEVCAGHYHPNYGAQRTCSRTCGVVLQQRNRQARGWVPAAQRPKPPKPHRQPREPKNGWPSSSLRHWTCRYCAAPCVGRVTRGEQRRKICGDRICHLARLQANNLRVRNGLTQDDADDQMAALVRATKASGRPTSLTVTISG
jgi:hypothetical protein